MLMVVMTFCLVGCKDKNEPKPNEEPTVTNKNSINGAMPGTFSVDMSKQIKFSQGNLQYHISTAIWRFAGNQYDYIGLANESALVGLFMLFIFLLNTLRLSSLICCSPTSLLV